VACSCIGEIVCRCTQTKCSADLHNYDDRNSGSTQSVLNNTTSYSVAWVYSGNRTSASGRQMVRRPNPPARENSAGCRPRRQNKRVRSPSKIGRQRLRGLHELLRKSAGRLDGEDESAAGDDGTASFSNELSPPSRARARTAVRELPRSVALLGDAAGAGGGARRAANHVRVARYCR